MPICNLKEVLEAAKDRDYAVPAFNVHNLEFVQGVMSAAEELRSPVILLLLPRSIEYAGFYQLLAIARAFGENSEVPTVVHLDHCGDLGLIERCIAEGFTSVMFDGSGLPFEENVEKTKRIVKMARPNNVSVEAELGIMGRFSKGVNPTFDEMRTYFTKPEEARQFYEATGIDALAVSCGTTHGMPIADAHLDVERLEEIDAAIPIPMVMHGCSGLQDAEYRKAYTRGVKKFNIGTKLAQAFVRGLMEEMAATGLNHAENAGQILRCLGAGSAAVCEAAKGRMQILNAANRF